MEIAPITVSPNPVEKKKPGPEKVASWKYDFFDKYYERLTMCEGEETLEQECKWLADWFSKKYKPAPGDDKRPITSGRLREIYRKRYPGAAKHYKEQRRVHLDRLLKAARAFLGQFPDLKLPE
jgi:hypothetical protein